MKELQKFDIALQSSYKRSVCVCVCKRSYNCVHAHVNLSAMTQARHYIEMRVLTYREGPCKNQVHYTCVNAAQEAATCVCSGHIHPEHESCSWRNDEPVTRAPCMQSSHKELGSLSASCHGVQLSGTHLCICARGPPLHHTVAGISSSLLTSSVSLVLSAQMMRTQ